MTSGTNHTGERISDGDKRCQTVQSAEVRYRSIQAHVEILQAFDRAAIGLDATPSRQFDHLRGTIDSVYRYAASRKVQRVNTGSTTEIKHKITLLE
jgi:hypothetical protein